VNAKRKVAETSEEYALRCAAAIGEDPDRYFQRAMVVRLESEVTEYDRELWQLATTMRDAIREGVAPRNPDSCVRFGQTCQFFGVCTGEESIDDLKWKRLEFPHPELTNDVRRTA
jgi:hypothetical protein